MNQLNIVLVEPQIPQNTGNVARTCSVTGAALHLIEPMGFTVTDARLKRAGLDYWQYLDITYYKDLEDFFSRTKGNYYYFSTKAEKIHSEVEYKPNTFLVYGKETAGLPPQLIEKNMDTACYIPMRNQVRSLNLSNSVAIGVYEVLRQWDYPSLNHKTL